ncbi:hypothetical protein [Alteromonas sp. S005]|uniref:hypothetical protein n=1 Tax=Alteromonas sp. S005 TaxID=3117400 RepID=UPI003F68B9F5
MVPSVYGVLSSYLTLPVEIRLKRFSLTAGLAMYQQTRSSLSDWWVSAETPAFATEHDPLLMFAVVTNNTQKSVFKTTTLKKFGKLFFHMAW